MSKWDTFDYVVAGVVAFFAVVFLTLIGGAVYNDIRANENRQDCVKYGMGLKYAASDIAVICGVRGK